MKMISLTCPECGAELETTSDRSLLFCVLYVLRKRRNDAMHADLDSHYNLIVVPGTNVRNR